MKLIAYKNYMAKKFPIGNLFRENIVPLFRSKKDKKLEPLCYIIKKLWSFLDVTAPVSNNFTNWFSLVGILQSLAKKT